jgi:hypothetical protein
MKQNSFTYDQLIDCAKGVLFGKGNAQLPMPPMLMFDRITSINEIGGVFSKGEVVAELDIKEEPKTRKKAYGKKSKLNKLRGLDGKEKEGK